jgi:hypothetical protein
MRSQALLFVKVRVVAVAARFVGSLAGATGLISVFSSNGEQHHMLKSGLVQRTSLSARRRETRQCDPHLNRDRTRPRRPGRDPRFRGVFREMPRGAGRTQSAYRGVCGNRREECPVLQDWQGNARAPQPASAVSVSLFSTSPRALRPGLSLKSPAPSAPRNRAPAARIFLAATIMRGIRPTRPMRDQSHRSEWPASAAIVSSCSPLPGEIRCSKAPSKRRNPGRRCVGTIHSLATARRKVANDLAHSCFPLMANAGFL